MSLSPPSPAVSWTISTPAGFKTFAALNLANLAISTKTQDLDIASFEAPGTAFDSAPIWKYHDNVIIMRNSDFWFAGMVIQTPRFGAPGEEAVTYKIAGPWWYLANLVFQQQWRLLQPAGPGGSPAAAPAWPYKARVIIGENMVGQPINSHDQIIEILTWAISCGAPFQIGQIGPDCFFPYDEQVDITCAEALKRVLHWTPDAVTWFDYTTFPPTFNCVRRSGVAPAPALAPVTIDVNQGDPNERIDITSRDDLQAPSVVIQYEQSSTYDPGGGAPIQTFESVTTDIYPPGATGKEFGAIAFCLALAGSSVIREKVTIQTAPIPDLFCSSPSATKGAIPMGTDGKAWWMSKVKWMNDPQVTNLTFTDGDRNSASIEGAPLYPNELIKGKIEPWMTPATNPDGHTTFADYDWAWCYVSYILVQMDNGGQETKKVVNRYIVYKFVATDLTDTDSNGNPVTYSHTTSTQPGEPIPTGAAQDLWLSCHPLQFDGQFVLLEEECTRAAGVGNILNLVNGLAAWTNMNALIVETKEEIDTGRTTIKFGPAKHLGPADLIEYLRGARGTVQSQKWNARSTGDSFDAGSSIETDAFVPLSSVVVGAGEDVEIVTTQSTPAAGSQPATVNQIRIVPSDVKTTGGPPNVTLQAREAALVSIDGENRTLELRQVLCSDPYGDDLGDTVTVIVGLQYDSVSHQIQIKTQNVYIMNAGEPSDWALAVQFYPCKPT